MTDPLPMDEARTATESGEASWPLGFSPHPRFSEFWRLLLMRGLKGILILTAISYILVYIVMAWQRVPYKYELEWLEGGMVHEVQRLMQGEPIYTAPTIEYAPFLYTPLYFYVSIPFVAVFGLNFMALRIVSFLASLVVFALLYRIAQRETNSHGAGIVAAGLFAATFRLGGAWFDTARVDSLLLMFLLLSFYVARFHHSWRAAILEGFLLAAAFLTKQSALAVIAPILFYLFLFYWRHALLTATVMGVLIAVSTAVLNHLNDGWYWYYFVEATVVSGFLESVWVDFWTKDLAAPLAISCALSLITLGLLVGRGTPRTYYLYLGATVGLVAISFISRMHVGGYDNVLMPLHAWLALLAAMATPWLCKLVDKDSPYLHSSLAASLCFVLIAQFALLVYNPWDQVPSKGDYAAWERIEGLIAGADGPVFFPYHSFIPALSGKQVFINRSAARGILDDRTHPDRQNLINSITNALREKRFALIISDSGDWFRREYRMYYNEFPLSYPNGEDGRPLTGNQVRPRFYYLPK